jgi:pimeloyl-ACP methyl ester carboxylesterase
MRDLAELVDPLQSAEQTTYVLVPGAWHGGWAWRPVAERLRVSGHRAVTLTLPGLGDGDDPSGHQLQDAIDHVVAALKHTDADRVTLVGHSWGGYPMVGAMHRVPHRVAKGIFYNALIPVPGQSMVDDTPPQNARILQDLADSSPNRTIASSLEFVQQLFMQDVAVDAQRLLSELLTPQPAGYFFDAFDGPDVTTLGIPLTYILSEHDQAMHRPGTEFASWLGVEPVMVPGTHDSLLTHPDAVAKAILAA